MRQPRPQPPNAVYAAAGERERGTKEYVVSNALEVTREHATSGGVTQEDSGPALSPVTER